MKILKINNPAEFCSRLTLCSGNAELALEEETTRISLKNEGMMKMLQYLLTDEKKNGVEILFTNSSDAHRMSEYILKTWVGSL